MSYGATAILAAHRLIRTDGELTSQCSCGWESDPVTKLDGKAEAHEAHLLSVFSAVHVIVELPEPIPRSDTTYGDELPPVFDYLGNRSRTQITVEPEGGRLKDGTPRGEWIVQEMRGASGQRYRANESGFHFVAALLAALTEAAKRNTARTSGGDA